MRATLYSDVIDRHDEDEPLEGEDFFFDYATKRSGMTATLTVQCDSTVVATPPLE
jgi:hypothetical protein